MTGQLKKIIAGVCVVAVLSASLVLVKFLPSKKSSSSGTSSSSSSEISIAKNDTTKISYVQVTNSTGTYTIRKAADNKFTVDTLIGAPLSDSDISSVVGAVATLSASQTVAQNPSDIAQYGLDAPTATAVVATTDNQKYTLKLGKADPMGSGSYLQKEGDGNVYLVDSSVATYLTQAATALVDKTLATVDSSKLAQLTKITFAGAARQKPVELDIDPTSVTSTASTSSDSTPKYNIVSPAPYNANDTNISTLCSELSSLSATSVVALSPTDAQLSSYGLLNPQYTLTFTYAGKQITLLFGNQYTDADNGEMVYTMVKGEKAVFGVATSSADFYNWQLSDIAGTLLWTVNIDDVKSMNVVAGSQSWNFNLDGTGDNLKVTTGSKTLNTDYFRQYYQTMLSFYQQGQASKPANGALRLRITLNYSAAGKAPKVLEFYTIDAYKAFYSIDGTGDFYVKQSDVDNFIKVSQDMADNKEVKAP